MIPSDRAPIVWTSGEQCSPVCAPQWSIHPCFQPLVTTLSVAATWTGRPLWSYIVHVGFVEHGWFMTMSLCRVMACSEAWCLWKLYYLFRAFRAVSLLCDIYLTLSLNSTQCVKVNHEWNVLEGKKQQQQQQISSQFYPYKPEPYLKFSHLFLESHCCPTAAYTVVCIVKFYRGLTIQNKELLPWVHRNTFALYKQKHFCLKH